MASHPPEAPPPKRKSRGRRLGWVALGVSLLAIGAWFGWPPARERLGLYALEQVSGLLVGTFHAREIEALSPAGVTLRGVRIDGPDGAPVVTAERLHVGIALGRLVRGELVLSPAEVDGAIVSLRDLTGELQIAETFLPVDDTPAPPDPEPSSFRLSVADIRLRDVRVVDLPEGLSLRVPILRGDVEYGPEGTGVDADVPALTATREEREVARGALRGRLALIEGAASRLSVSIEAGESALSADLETRYEAETFTLPAGTLALSLHPSLAKRVGHPELGAYLRAPVSVDAKLDVADSGDAQAALTAATPGGKLKITGGLEGDALHARIFTAGLDLRPVLGPEVPHPLSGDVTLSLGPASGAGAARAFDVVAERVRVAGWRQPRTRLSGSVSDERLKLQRLAVPAWTREGGHLRVRLDAGFDGDVRADVDIELLRPLLGGRLSQELDVQGDALRLSLKGRYWHTRGEVDAVLDADTQGLSSSGVSVQLGRAHVLAKGPLLRPRLDVQLEAQDLRFPKGRVRFAELRAVGSGDYQTTLRVQGNRVTLTGNVRAQVARERVRVEGDLYARGAGRPETHAHLGEVVVQGGGVSVQGMRLTAGRHYLKVDGRYHPQRGGEVAASMSGFDLEAISQLALVEDELGAYALRGQLSGDVQAKGTIARPEVQAELRGQGLSVKGVTLGDLDTRVALSAKAGTAALDLRVDPPGLDRLKLELKGRFARRGAAARTLPRGRYDLQLDAMMTDLEALAPLAPELLKDASGGVEVKGTLEGSRGEGVAGSVQVTANRLSASGMGPASFGAGLELDEQASHLKLEVTDDEGLLAEVDARAETGVVALVERPLDAVPWEVQAHVPRRRLDAMPPPAAVALPVRLDARAKARGQGMRVTAIEATAHARYEQGPSERAEGCEEVFPELDAEVQFGDGQADLHAELTAGAQRVVEVTAKGALGSLSMDTFELTGKHVEVTARARQLSLGELPYLCGHARGKANLELTAQGMLSGRPRATLKAEIEGLGGLEGPRLDVRVDADADARGARATAAAVQGTRETLSLKAQVPWTWRDMGGPRDLGKPRAEVRMDRLELEPLAAPFPDTLRAKGQLSGRARLRSLEPTLDVEGRLQLHDVYLGLAEPALRLENLHGELQLDHQLLRFDRLRWGDREGRMVTSGEVKFGEDGPRRARVEIEASDLPLRNDGIPFANIDTHTRVNADFTTKPAQVHVKIRDLTVKLTEQLGRSTQGLDPHPDVVYVDSAPLEEEKEEEEGAGEEQPAFAARVSLETEKPFWVRHEDFAVQIEPRLQIVTDDQGARISGPLLVRRGYVNLVGRTFSFERGEIRFDGGQELDPSVDITARHKLSGAEYVEVKIGGHLSKPTIHFSTNVAGVGDNETEIMALLVRGNQKDGGTSAAAEAGAMLSGLTAGFLSSLTRGKYGDYVPMLALEAGSGTGTRLRAGIQMDDFIPKSWRRVVQGAYVEGYVGGGGSGGGSSSGSGSNNQRGATGGVLIELYLPRDLTASGTWDQPTNWSLDLLWEPLR